MLPSRSATYGPEYEQLTLAAFAKTPFKLPVATEGKAKILRARIYGYWRALREENLRMDLIEMADSLVVYRDGALLTFTTKEESWEAKAIRQALGLADDFYTNGNAKGTGELHVPDLLQNRLTKKIQAIRDRQSQDPGQRGQKIVPPL